MRARGVKIHPDELAAMKQAKKAASGSKEDTAVTTTVETAVIAEEEDADTKDANLEAAGTTATGKKRQRTLMDMFGGTVTTTSTSSRSAKKAKLENEPGVEDSFSVSAYETELSDEERDLLALECETMGKSW